MHLASMLQPLHVVNITMTHCVGNQIKDVLKLKNVNNQSLKRGIIVLCSGRMIALESHISNLRYVSCLTHDLQIFLLVDLKHHQLKQGGNFNIVEWYSAVHSADSDLNCFCCSQFHIGNKKGVMIKQSVYTTQCDETF